MRSFHEFKGQSTRLDYDRERGEFVARPEPHPFVVSKAAREGTLKPRTKIPRKAQMVSEPSSAAHDGFSELWA